MNISATPFAKFDPPWITGYFPRRNLFRILDAAGRRPIVWISAPAKMEAVYRALFP